MISLRAPHPSIEAISWLPDPLPGDVEFPVKVMRVRRSLNGRRRTYVKDAGVRSLTYEFRLSVAKFQELQAFVNTYFDKKIRLRNHKNENWIVNIITNPLQYSMISNNAVAVQLQMQGVKQ